MSGTFIAVLDGQGTIRDAQIAPQDSGRMSDPHFRAFAERAMRAARDPRCASIGAYVPLQQLGAVNKLTIHFTPG